jgi:hypothetical protein
MPDPRGPCPVFAGYRGLRLTEVNLSGHPAEWMIAPCGKFAVAYRAHQSKNRRVPMARPLQIQVVERARFLIADEQRWCRGDLARDVHGEGVCPTSASAVKWCALGALLAAAHELTHDFAAAQDFAVKSLRPQCGTSTLVRVNDMGGHAAALALFDEVPASSRRGR